MADREVRVSLASRYLPVNEDGDVHFESLEEVLQHFEPVEVVTMVERWVRVASSARESNKKRTAKLREAERPVKEAAKVLFPTKSFADLTPTEYRRAVEKAYDVSEKER